MQLWCQEVKNFQQRYYANKCQVNYTLIKAVRRNLVIYNFSFARMMSSSEKSDLSELAIDKSLYEATAGTMQDGKNKQ